MNRRWTLLIAVPLFSIPLACDEPAPPPEPIKAAAVTSVNPARDSRDDLDARLLSSLPNRRSWNTRSVKVDLDKPDLRVELDNPSGQRRIVDAWSNASNDFNVPLVRVDWSELLYEITPAEWAFLQRRAGG